MTKNFHRNGKTLWLKSFDENWLAVVLESRRKSFRNRMKEAWRVLRGDKNHLSINLDGADIRDMIDYLKEIQ